MSIRLLAATYGRFTDVVRKACKTITAPDIEIILKEGKLEDIIDKVMAVPDIDVIISSGANGHILSSVCSQPVICVAPTGYDLLLALNDVAKHAKRAVIIVYKQKIEKLALVSRVFNIGIKEYTFSNVPEVYEILQREKERGYADAIGSSFVCEAAKEFGMRGHLIYSESSVLRAFETAIMVARSKKKEQDDARQLHSILGLIQEGMVVTNEIGRISLFNERAEKVLGLPASKAIGRDADELLPELELCSVIQKRQQTYNKICSVGSQKILINRIPIVNNNAVIGALATFQSTNAVQKSEEKIRNHLSEKGFVARHVFDDILGESRILAQTKEKACLYARSEATVLLKGESGCGKDLFAQSIHNASGRAKRPFVAVNCAAFSTTLLESELFGYEEGAFTGARKSGKLGIFELAHGGTIFLDEIAEIDVNIQTRLLRVLEQRELLRMGSEKIIHVDIRIIAATNRDLWQMVRQGKFRNDLYYRLNILEMDLPSLRERSEDIPLIFKQFLKAYAPHMTEEDMNTVARDPVLTSYSWPGNVRELKNIAERFSILSRGAGHYDEILHSFFSKKMTDMPDTDFADTETIRKILRECRNNRSLAARKLGISRTTLWRKLRSLEESRAS